MPTRVIRPTSSLGITTQWSTTLSSKVNLPHVINFRAKYGANLVTEPSNFEVTKPSDSTEWVSVLVLNQGLSLFSYHWTGMFSARTPSDPSCCKATSNDPYTFPMQVQEEDVVLETATGPMPTRIIRPVAAGRYGPVGVPRP